MRAGAIDDLRWTMVALVCALTAAPALALDLSTAAEPPPRPPPPPANPPPPPALRIDVTPQNPAPPAPPPRPAPHPRGKRRARECAAL